MTDNQKLSPDDIEQNNLVLLGADGDPLPQGTRMLEKESYERVIEGLKMAADASVHLVRSEPENFAVWRGLAARLDAVRRISIQKAGFDSVGAASTTEQLWKRSGMSWREAHKRLRDGLKQAAGGMRQLAVCWRGDISWSELANVVEAMEVKLSRAARRNTRSSLILPGFCG